MNSTFVRAACAAFLTTASAGAPAYESQPLQAPESAAEAGAQPERPTRRPGQPERLICRTVDAPGSALTPMVCMSAADWRRAGQ